jgi:hypothetical protein
MVVMEQALLHCLAVLDPTAAAVELAAFSPGADSGERSLSEEALIALTTPSSILRKTRPATVSERQTLWKWIAAAVAAVVVGVVVVVALRSGGQDPRKPSDAERSAASQTMKPAMKPMERPHPRVAMAVGTRETMARWPPPMLPAKIRVTCMRVVPASVKVYDARRKLLGSCKTGFELPLGDKPTKVRLYQHGWVEKWIPLTPNRDQSIGPSKLRKLGMGGGGEMLPDDAMKW